MLSQMQMRRPLTRTLAEALDAASRQRGISRASAARRAGIDTSTLWRAVHSGKARPGTMADFAETIAAMMTDPGRVPGAPSAAAGLISIIAEWIGDRRRPAGAPEAALAELTVLAPSEAFRRRFGAPGQAFVELANARALGGEDSPAQRAALAALALLLLEEAA